MSDKKKILMIDDESSFLTVMGKRIISWEYDLITATNGKDGISLINKEDPDIVILDYIMPDMDGIQTLRGIRKHNIRVPVIMFTAYPDSRSIGGAEKLGVTAYIPKLSAYSNVSSLLKTAIEMALKQVEQQK